MAGRYLAIGAGLAAAGVFSAIVAAVTTSAVDGDLLEAPWFVPSILWLTLLCVFASWMAPAGGPYWGAVATAPYLVTFIVQVARHPAPPQDADFAPLAFGGLLVACLVPWGIAWAVGRARQNRRPPIG